MALFSHLLPASLSAPETSTLSSGFARKFGSAFGLSYPALSTGRFILMSNLILFSLLLSPPLRTEHLGCPRLVGHIGFHSIPINCFPPVAQILPLSIDGIIAQIRMLPRANAQYWRNARTSWGNPRLVLAGVGVCTKSTRRVVDELRLAGKVAVLVGGLVLVVHVHALLSEAGFGVRRTGEVGGENSPAAGAVGCCTTGAARRVDIAGPHEPDVAWAEHGGGRVKHCRAQIFDAAECAEEGVLEEQAILKLDRVCGEAREEKVVVLGGRGVVEQRGVHGIASEHDDKIFRGKVFDVGAGDEFVQFAYQALLILGPADSVTIDGPQAPDTFLREGIIVVEFGDAVVGAAGL